jgi:hypothetical protein
MNIVPKFSEEWFCLKEDEIELRSYMNTNNSSHGIGLVENKTAAEDNPSRMRINERSSASASSPLLQYISPILNDSSPGANSSANEELNSWVPPDSADQDVMMTTAIPEAYDDNDARPPLENVMSMVFMCETTKGDNGKQRTSGFRAT